MPPTHVCEVSTILVVARAPPDRVGDNRWVGDEVVVTDELLGRRDDRCIPSSRPSRLRRVRPRSTRSERSGQAEPSGRSAQSPIAARHRRRVGSGRPQVGTHSPPDPTRSRRALDRLGSRPTRSPRQGARSCLGCAADRDPSVTRRVFMHHDEAARRSTRRTLSSGRSRMPRHQRIAPRCFATWSYAVGSCAELTKLLPDLLPVGATSSVTGGHRVNLRTREALLKVSIDSRRHLLSRP